MYGISRKILRLRLLLYDKEIVDYQDLSGSREAAFKACHVFDIVFSTEYKPICQHSRTGMPIQLNN